MSHALPPDDARPGRPADHTNNWGDKLRHWRNILQKLTPGWALAGMLAFYVLAGLFGHDPWKDQDAIHIGVSYELLRHGHWLALELGGRVWLHEPLYYWSASLFGLLFGDWLFPLHSALRLGSGFWMALALVAIYYAGREYYGPKAAAASPLLLIGSVGLVVIAHEAQPMLVALAAYCGALGAVGALPRKPQKAARLYGLSFAACLLSSGYLVSLPLLLFALWALFDRLLHKERISLTHPLIINLSMALLAFCGWMLLLWIVKPDYFTDWWRHSLVQMNPYSHSFGESMLGFALKLPWFAWPALPVACWSLWRNLRQPSFGGLLHPLVLLLFTLPVLAWGFRAHNEAAILLLPPICLMATPGVLSLRRGAANAFDWFSRMVFAIFFLLAWIGWSAMVVGWPEKLAERAVVLEPGFVGEFSLFPFALAFAATVWWLLLILRLPRSQYRCLIQWSAGFSVFWLLLATLWLPWIDYGKSYRKLSHQLSAQLPTNVKSGAGCVAERSVGDAQRASFAYFSELRLQPWQTNSDCRWLLIKGSARQKPASPGSDWQLVWQGNRQGDSKERFRLYRR